MYASRPDADASSASSSSNRRKHWGLKEHGGKSLISTYFINVPPVRVWYRAAETPGAPARDDYARRTKNPATPRQSRGMRNPRHPGANRPQRLRASVPAHAGSGHAAPPAPRNAQDTPGNPRPVHQTYRPHTLAAGKTIPR